MTHTTMGIERHPDIAAIQARYDRAALSSGVQFLAGITMLTGLYAAISPWVIGFRPAALDLRVTDLICGLAVALLAAACATAYGRTHGMTWVSPVIGAWLVVAPWVVLGSNVAAGSVVSNIITGGLVLIFGIASAAVAGSTSRSRG